MMLHNNNKLHRSVLLIPVCVVAMFFSVSQGVHARIKYGLWQITVEVIMDGTPVDAPAETFEKCITRNNLTPGDNKDKQGCEKDKVTRKGDTVNWTVSCARDKHTMTGSGVVTYSGNSMTGNAQFQAGGHGLATMNMKLNYKGKRLGRCK